MASGIANKPQGKCSTSLWFSRVGSYGLPLLKGGSVSAIRLRRTGPSINCGITDEPMGR